VTAITSSEQDFAVTVVTLLGEGWQANVYKGLSGKGRGAPAMAGGTPALRYAIHSGESG